jgi:HlyD family secretion protein
MNAQDTLKKILVPALGVLLAVALVFQLQRLHRGPFGDGTGSSGDDRNAVAGERAAAARRGARAGGPAVSEGQAGGGSGSNAETPEAGGVVAEGRLVTYPGGLVVVSSDAAGTITRLPVAEKDHVRKGQLLAELRADDLRAELAQARARIAEAAADLRFAELDAARAERLLAAQVTPQATLDRSRSSRDAALARRETAQADVRRLEALLAKTRIVAPMDGTLVERTVQPGERVAPGAPLLTLADLGHTRIEAEVDEFDAGRIRLGAPVAVSAEGYGARWRGHVEEVPDSVVTRRLKPQDPGRPSDTRVLLVKVALDELTPLKLSQRVEVAITPAPPGPSGTPASAARAARR